MASGNYRVTLTVDGNDFSQELRVVSDPNLSIQTELGGSDANYDVWTGDSDRDDEQESQETEEEERGESQVIDSDG